MKSVKIDDLYFAPGIRYDDVDWQDDSEVVKAFEKRLCGLYMEPTRELCDDDRNVFAAGVMCTVTIDMLARFTYDQQRGVRKRFTKWLKDAESNFKCTSLGEGDKSLADRVYEDFRNGTVHEGRVKKGGQFSLRIDGLFATDNGIIVLNPEKLLELIKCQAKAWIETLQEDSDARKKFCDTLREDLEDDIAS